MKKWLFLRGYYDERTKQSLIDNDDMWMQLFDAVGGGDDIQTLFINEEDHQILNDDYTHIFARGGLKEYEQILCKYPNAYKIYYGAGKRFIPSDYKSEGRIKYDLILCDTEDQSFYCRAHNYNAKLFTKPAAEHFKPARCAKEYDVCYIANGTQSIIKGIQWVYNNAPSDIKILHLGYQYKSILPDNINNIRVNRIDMPKWISKCKIGIVPYTNYDSCPRVIPEMMACNLPIVALESVNFNHSMYPCAVCNYDMFWDVVKSMLKFSHGNTNVDYYNNNLTIEHAAKLIRSYIE